MLQPFRVVDVVQNGYDRRVKGRPMPQVESDQFQAGSPLDDAIKPGHDDEWCVGLPPMLDEESFPIEFRDVLEVKILGYRETGMVTPAWSRIVMPIWTLVPKD
jgi:hypothetical protein